MIDGSADLRADVDTPHFSLTLTQLPLRHFRQDAFHCFYVCFAVLNTYAPVSPLIPPLPPNVSPPGDVKTLTVGVEGDHAATRMSAEREAF